MTAYTFRGGKSQSPFRLDPFSEGLVRRKTKRKAQKLSPLENISTHIDLDKAFYFFNPKVSIFFLFLDENYVFITHKSDGEVLLMSTHNISFC